MHNRDVGPKVCTFSYNVWDMLQIVFLLCVVSSYRNYFDSGFSIAVWIPAGHACCDAYIGCCNRSCILRLYGNLWIVAWSSRKQPSITLLVKYCNETRIFSLSPEKSNECEPATA